MFKKILVPLDGSELSELALPLLPREEFCHNDTDFCLILLPVVEVRYKRGF
ncbi:hypothetical protein ACFLTR_00860 [Chloroflexota bacterium]